MKCCWIVWKKEWCVFSLSLSLSLSPFKISGLSLTRSLCVSQLSYPSQQRFTGLCFLLLSFPFMFLSYFFPLFNNQPKTKKKDIFINKANALRLYTELSSFSFYLFFLSLYLSLFSLSLKNKKKREMMYISFCSLTPKKKNNKNTQSKVCGCGEKI